jgi:EAL domain-containing protein (putative c-di-GMP-specific phosphodiesterase class I)
MGIQIELDDFGTGYSSLNLLKNLPINTLKIDRSLIHGIETGSQGKTLVRAAIAMARAMSMTVISEGVETERQESFLVEEGCDIMQGFRYARPMPLTDFMAYLADSTRPGSKGEKPRLIVLEAGNHG